MSSDCCIASFFFQDPPGFSIVVVLIYMSTDHFLLPHILASTCYFFLLSTCFILFLKGAVMVVLEGFVDDNRYSDWSNMEFNMTLICHPQIFHDTKPFSHSFQPFKLLLKGVCRVLSVFFIWFTVFIIIFWVFDIVEIPVIVEGCPEHTCRLEDNLGESVFLFHHVGLRGQTHALRHNSKDICQLRCLIAYSLNCTGAFSSMWSFLSILAIISSNTGVLFREIIVYANILGCSPHVFYNEFWH